MYSPPGLHRPVLVCYEQFQTSMVDGSHFEVRFGRTLPVPTRATRSGERARFVGLFQGCTGLWTAGCWLARRLRQLKASTTMDLGISLVLISVPVQCVALRILDLLIKTGWSVIFP